MPRGTMKWFDARSGEGRVHASRREYPAFGDEVEPAARVAGARVRFDVARVNGVRVAVRVEAIQGTRTSRKQRRFGDLTGAGRVVEKGRSALTRRRTGVDPQLPGRPVDLVRRWIAGANSGHLDTVLPLYAPAAVLHASDGDHHGRGAIRAYLVDNGLLTRGWDAKPVGAGETVEVVRGPAAADAGRRTRFRLEHGQICEQWVDEPA
ncbi:MAG TPA: nuclear transport factor 2 family protein [Euzebyales bacterium]|nr:nuclear transport factor 2 family protein [Euzebyales bacterium]